MNYLTRDCNFFASKRRKALVLDFPDRLRLMKEQNQRTITMQ